MCLPRTKFLIEGHMESVREFYARGEKKKLVVYCSVKVLQDMERWVMSIETWWRGWMWKVNPALIRRWKGIK
jgi:hypothetical protein